MTVSFSPLHGVAGNRGIQVMRANLTEKVVTLLIFSYWVIYEHIIFFYSEEFGGPAFLLLTNAIKLLLPLFLLFLTGLPGERIAARGLLGLYIFFFSAFLLWGLVPTLVAGDVLSWFKLLPRFVFFLSLVAFYSKRPAAFSLLAKCIVIYVLFALLQYALLYLTGAYASAVATPSGLMAGPFGLLGNVTSMMYFSGLTFVRLCGFWNEPNNAAGSAFVAFFLARYLVLMNEAPFWRSASYACFVAGLLTLSVGGYFTIGFTLLVGVFFDARRVTGRRIFNSTVLLASSVALLGMVVFGRSFVVSNLPDNAWARAITGVRNLEGSSLDASGGRLDLLRAAIDITESKLIGVGLQEVGSRGIEGSGTAPVYWLLLTGIPGLSLILCREGLLLTAARGLLRKMPHLLPLVQALIAVMAQHLSYGTWMNPNYFNLAAMILVCSSRSTQQLLVMYQQRHGLRQ